MTTQARSTAPLITPHNLYDAYFDMRPLKESGLWDVLPVDMRCYLTKRYALGWRAEAEFNRISEEYAREQRLILLGIIP